jgi:hypothetical protein
LWYLSGFSINKHSSAAIGHLTTDKNRAVSPPVNVAKKFFLLAGALNIVTFPQLHGGFN